MLTLMEEINKKVTTLKAKSVEFEHAVREKTFGYIVASFGLVAGLAWNEAVKAFIESFFPMQKDTIKAKFIYALFITVVLVFISVYMARIFKKRDDEMGERK
ncbi:MAG: DUF5654 family protein [Patescibacteria group bacterium]|jgi:nucleoside permease NupC